MRMSLTKRLFVSTSVVLGLFLLMAGVVLDQAFSISLDNVVRERSRLHTYNMLSLADNENGVIRLPTHLAGKRFNSAGDSLLGFVSDIEKKESWRSISAAGKLFDLPHPAEGEWLFGQVQDESGQSYYVSSFSAIWPDSSGKIEGGFYVNHTTDLGRFRFSLLTDMGSEHDGQRATASYTFDLHAGNWNINPSIGAQWMSSGIVDHYYGVSSIESTTTRAAYKGSSAVNLFAGVRAKYEISDRWDFNASTGFTRLNDNITSSSIVDDDYGYHGNLSMNYKF
jgi:hypothetical protein